MTKKSENDRSETSSTPSLMTKSHDAQDRLMRLVWMRDATVAEKKHGASPRLLHAAADKIENLMNRLNRP